MKVQVHHDNVIEGSAKLIEQTAIEVADALARFDDRLTRVEVHLGNESAGRTTGDDFRCRIEARVAGKEPIVVTHHAATLTESVRGATDKMETVLTKTFEKREGHQSRETIRGH